MYAVTITLKDGRKLSGVINARSAAHARALVRDADSGRDVAHVDATSTW